MLRYSVTTGFMPLKSDTGDVEARLFFMAYTLERSSGPEVRPLMFSFNGGPGSSSVWLHLGALGPKRVKMRADGQMPSPPYKLVDNEQTWLDDTDLVFIDPVGTGYSRPAKPELGKKYWGVQGDIESVGEFIRLYLTRYERWASPLFLVGESYGTTRAAGLSGYLVEKGIAFNGILLVSSILNFQTARFTTGNDLPYPLFLPTYAATAWYHKKLPPDLQSKPLGDFLREVETFAAADYPNALQKGDRMSAPERQEMVKRVSRYTGLSESYVDESDLRIEIQRFCKELLRREGRTVGRLDSRFRGSDSSGVAERPEFDPSMTAIRPPYTATFNDYVRRSLGYKTDTVYHIPAGIGAGIWRAVRRHRRRSATPCQEPRHAARGEGFTTSRRRTSRRSTRCRTWAYCGTARDQHWPVRGGPHDGHPRRRARPAEAGRGEVHRGGAGRHRPPRGARPRPAAPYPGRVRIRQLTRRSLRRRYPWRPGQRDGAASSRLRAR